MPIEDAILLVRRNFDSYMRGENTDGSAVGSIASQLAERHPEPIQVGIYYHYKFECVATTVFLVVT